jgi:hypothetical protein
MTVGVVDEASTISMNLFRLTTIYSGLARVSGTCQRE